MEKTPFTFEFKNHSGKVRCIIETEYEKDDGSYYFDSDIVAVNLPDGKESDLWWLFNAMRESGHTDPIEFLSEKIKNDINENKI